tara:strand:+ start:151 stop:360 length:210 start_codon:yes stop_codon:yes gene_type:complete
MSGENLAADTSNLKRDPNVSSTKQPHHKVDINHLFAKLQKEEKSKKKESIILLSLVVSVIGITGIIASF